MNDRNISPTEDGRAALRMIRETIETYGPPGLLPPETQTPGPKMVDEAAVLCAGIIMLAMPKEEIETLRTQLEGVVDNIGAVQPEIRALIQRLWPDLAAKLPPA